MTTARATGAGPIPPARAAEILLAEFKRRLQWRSAVKAAGWEPADTWVGVAAVTKSIAKVMDERPESMAFRRELRQYLLAAGWKERRVAGLRQWGSRKVQRGR